MAEAAENGDEGNTRRGRKNVTRNAFPRIDFTRIVELVDAVWQEGQGEAVRRSTAFGRIKKSPDSGPSRAMVTAANGGYGLLTGNYQSAKLELTERGRRYTNAITDRERLEVMHESLFDNPIFTAIVNRYEHRTLPSDSVIADYISSNHSLSPEDASLCWSVISTNLHDAKMITSEAGKDVIIPSSEALASLSNQHIDGKDVNNSVGTQVPLARSIHDSDNESSQHETDRTSMMVPPQFHFNIQIHLPSDADPASYDAIFSSIRRNLLHTDVD